MTTTRTSDGIPCRDCVDCGRLVLQRYRGARVPQRCADCLPAHRLKLTRDWKAANPEWTRRLDREAQARRRGAHRTA